jgi:glycosyltransferase involved in cell wall biosynthesis
MAACWRELSRQERVDLHVIAFQVGAGEKHIAFSESILQGIQHELLSKVDAENPAVIFELVLKQKPDVVVLPGWFNAAYTAMPSDDRFANVKFMMTMDTPWRDQWRQKIARLRIGAYLDRMSAVVVAGERAWQYARQLRIPEQKILRGVYGFNGSPLEDILERRKAGAWPKKFLYVGRYVQDKGIDVLAGGYEQYRRLSKEPWPLDCCGQGPMRDKLLAVKGVNDLGFVQPADLPRVLLEHGAYVIASRYEPWGVAIAEAQYSGLPVICTEACGASVEVVRHLSSGVLIPTEDPVALADAMLWMEQHVSELPAMGEQGKCLATPFMAQFWARRWHTKLKQILADT